MSLNETDKKLETALDRARNNLTNAIGAIRGLTSETEAKLREALMNARGKLFEQARAIEELTGVPVVHATVVGITKDNVTVHAVDESQPRNAPRPKNGTKMRVLKSNYIGEVGTVDATSGTSIRLEFSGDRSHVYQYFHDFYSGKKCTLRIRKTGSQKPADFVDGALIERVEDKRWGKVMSDGPDEDGEVEVEWRDDRYSSDSQYVGFAENPNEVEVVENLRVLIAINGTVLEVPSYVGYDLKIGDTVRVNHETKAILGKAEGTITTGPLATVVNLIDHLLCEVSVEDAARVVYAGHYTKKLEVGMRVMLDQTGIVIVRHLPAKSEHAIKSMPNVQWCEIGGLEEAKKQMIEIVELPHRNPEIYRHYGKKPVNGVLLYGPPRCGKTMIGKAAATSLANIYGSTAMSTGFMYVKGPEILDRYVGVAEGKVRQMFAHARKHKQKHGYPAVIFIDEADALLGKRGSGISSDVEKTIVPMFLVEMDGLEDSGALVILATNRPDVLDPAIVGDGRVDRKIKITRPTFESTREILALNLKNVPLSNGYTSEDLAEVGAMEMFLNTRKIYEVRMKDGGSQNFALHHIVNGGMIANIVDHATSIAIARDIEAKRHDGIRKDDIVAAVNAIEKQNLDLNHTDALSEFVHDFREEVLGVHKLRQSAAV